MQQFAFASSVAVLAVISVTLASAAPKPKFTIKEVMKEAIKGNDALVKKACKGTATPEELAKMVEYFKAMKACVPPKGDLDSWEKKAGALLDAAVRVQKSPKDKDASYALEQAVECRQCHTPHKPAKK